MGIFIDCTDWNAFTVTDLDPRSSPGCPKKITKLTLHALYAYATAEDADRAQRHGGPTVLGVNRFAPTALVDALGAIAKHEPPATLEGATLRPED